MTKDEFFADVKENRNIIGRCPCCNSNIKDRTVTIWKGLIIALYKVYVWCGENKRHEFKMKDIREMIGTQTYARFANLIRFGGIIYRPKGEEDSKNSGHYGINMARAKEFFHGTRTMPIEIVLNQITNKIISQTECYWHEFPALCDFMKSNGAYDFESQVKSYPVIPEKSKTKKVMCAVVDRERGVAVLVENN